MSLQFGLFLVEQGVISPDQFCGLVRIQQQLSPAPSHLALKHELLSIRQIARIYQSLDEQPAESFLSLAVQKNYMTPENAQHLERAVALLAPSLTEVLVECGLVAAGEIPGWRARFEAARRRPPSTAIEDEERLEAIAPDSGLPRAPLPPPNFKQRPRILHRSAELQS